MGMPRFRQGCSDLYMSVGWQEESTVGLKSQCCWEYAKLISRYCSFCGIHI